MSVRSEAWGTLDLDEVQYPITYWYTVTGPWGTTHQWLTVEAPAVAGNQDAIIALGPELWAKAIAGAITADSALVMTVSTVWREPTLGGFAPLPPVFGGLSGAPAPAEDAAVLVMNTGKLDPLGSRRLYLGGIPARWVAHRLLTEVGMRALEGQAQAMVMGLCGHLTGSPLRWLIAYPNLLDATLENPQGVAFRRVEYVAVAHHTARVRQAPA